MIRFRCWYCNERYTVADESIGERITCTCERRVRVPQRSGGPSRSRTPIEYLVERLVYSAGGAFLGLGLGLMIAVAVGYMFSYRSVGGWTLILIPALTIVGFCAGLFGGEAGVNWIGRLIRQQEEDW